MSHPFDISGDQCADSATSSRNLLNCADELEKAGQFQAADSAFRAAVLSDDDPQLRLSWAEFLMRIEEFDRAEQLYRQLWQLSDPNDRSLQSVIANNLAIVCRLTGQTAEAVSLQAHSQRWSEETGSGETHAAVDLTGRALNAVLQGDYRLAEDLLLRSLEVDRAQSSVADVADDCGNLAVLAGLRGRHAVALRFLGRAYRLHRELYDDHGAGADMMNAAEVFLKLGRTRLGMKCYSRAIRSFESCGAGRSAKEARQRLLEVQRIEAVRRRDPTLN